MIDNEISLTSSPNTKLTPLDDNNSEIEMKQIQIKKIIIIIILEQINNQLKKWKI